MDFENFLAQLEPLGGGGTGAGASPTPAVPDLDGFGVARFLGAPPPIEYLIDGVLPRGIVAMLAAAGGMSKSFLCLELAMRVAGGGRPGDPPLFGGPVVRAGRAVVLTAEDSADAVHRRIAALDPDGTRRQALTRSGLFHVLCLGETSFTRPLMTGADGGFRFVPAWLEFLRRELVARRDVELIVIDPLASFVAADVNSDPAAGAALMAGLAEAAGATGATVLVCHHMRKGGAVASGLMEARDAVRGTSALTDGVRWAYTLQALAEADGRALCERMGLEFHPGRAVVGCVAKANGPSDRRPHYYVRGDDGVLRAVEGAGRAAPTGAELAASVADAIGAALEKGAPFTRTGPRSVGRRRRELPPALAGRKAGELDALADDAMRRGLVVALPLRLGHRMADYLARAGQRPTVAEDGRLVVIGADAAAAADAKGAADAKAA